MSNVYSGQKMLKHMESLAAIKRGDQPYPVRILLMPCNACNLNCNFCAYRIVEDPHKHLFDCKSSIPENVMVRLIEDFKNMGGKAIELTGGGEPLMYKHIDLLVDLIIRNRFDLALVSNGTLLTEELAKKMAPHLSWARISIDTDNPKVYSLIKKSSEKAFNDAWKAVRLLRKYGAHPDFSLGLSFVMANENAEDVYNFCVMAKEHGVDNVRISVTVHPDGLNYFGKDVLKKGRELAKRAEELSDDKFKVYNFFDERISCISVERQDYHYCGTKDFLCVIGGSGDVYTCGSLAFCDKGHIGNIGEHGLKFLWDSEKKKKFFLGLDPTVVCDCHCLYDTKNRFLIEALKDVPHGNFT